MAIKKVDIKKALRRHAGFAHVQEGEARMCQEAAAEIDRLERQLDAAAAVDGDALTEKAVLLDGMLDEAHNDALDAAADLFTDGETRSRIRSLKRGS